VLLREAIRESGRIGIAKFIMRDVQHLAAVEAIDDALVLSTLRFADELIDVKTLNIPKGKDFRKKELEMATSLVENLAQEWMPESLHRRLSRESHAVDQGQAERQEADLVSAEQPRDANVIDLMERLQRSLQATGGRPPPPRLRRDRHPDAAPIGACTDSCPQEHRAAPCRLSRQADYGCVGCDILLNNSVALSLISFGVRSSFRVEIHQL
jgi:non-homologous end joining protein Ku